MATTTLSAEKDPMGTAISDYLNHHKAGRLRVFSSQFEEDEIPVKELFRDVRSMPVLERTALQMANTIPSSSICPIARTYRTPSSKYNPLASSSAQPLGRTAL